MIHSHSIVLPPYVTLPDAVITSRKQAVREAREAAFWNLSTYLFRVECEVRQRSSHNGLVAPDREIILAAQRHLQRYPREWENTILLPTTKRWRKVYQAAYIRAAKSMRRDYLAQ